MTFAAVTAACSGTEREESAGSPDALRSDPNGEVSTSDASVRLLSGYNAFIDRASSNPCVVETAPGAPNVGDVRGTFYLRHVKTRDELAKELDVDVGASLSAPAGSLDASTKVVKTFKSSSTTVTFLVRALRSYSVANRSALSLTPDAHALLKDDDTSEFLKKCGGSFVQSVRYEAQVLAMMQFEAQNESSAQKIEASLTGGSTQLVPLANAKADLQTKAEQIDQLRAEMNTSFDADLAADRRDYLANRSRNVRPAIVGQNSYAQIADAPNADFTRITTTLARAEEFVRYLGPVQLRMETVYSDEVMRFLTDTQNDQLRYNLTQNPKLKTQDLVPIAQKWATAFGPDGTRNPGSLIDPLAMAIERCQAAASNGDYSACTSDPVIDQSKESAEAALADYARTGRIVQLSAWMPILNKTMSYYRAEDACQAADMRLPKREEMPFIAPAVTALASPSGEVWFAGDAQCAKPYYQNGNGQGAYACDSSFAEALPYVGDRAVVCVGRTGPIGALPAP